MDNVTRCICPASGTFAVLLAKKNFNVSILWICLCLKKNILTAKKKIVVGKRKMIVKLKQSVSF